MTPSKRRALLLFAFAAIAVVAALFWLTLEVRTLEAESAQSKALVRRQDAMRVALWRMDSLASGWIAREAARPPEDWLAFHTPSLAFNCLCQRVQPNEVITPSPLLTDHPPLFPLYFQLEADGSVTSPQVPQGRMLQLAQQTLLPGGPDPSLAAALAHVTPQLQRADLLGRIAAAEAQSDILACEPDQTWAADRPSRQETATLAVVRKELQVRSSLANTAAQQAGVTVNFVATADLEQPTEAKTKWQAAVAQPSVGPMVLLWLGGPGEEDLVAVRAVRNGTRTVVQGMLCDWSAMHLELLSQVEDIMPSAALRPVLASNLDPDRLASLPALLFPGNLPGLFDSAAATPTAAILWAAWLAALAALAAAGCAIVVGFAYGDNQRRFASSVTHELRTPLTTFQLYSDLLAEGMVTDEAARTEYLRTLRSEAQRLAQIIENMLCFARLQRGAPPRPAEPVELGEFVERLRGHAAQRVASAGGLLDWHFQGEGTVRVDASAVEQVVSNLVDNACKYSPSPARIEVSLVQHGNRLRARVLDSGPGIPARERARIFRPFERLGEDAPTTPGAGLGLSIARSMAEGIGGKLRCVEPPAGRSGACFELDVPAVPVAPEVSAAPAAAPHT